MNDMKTEQLIRSLATDAQPVRRLSHPFWRAMSGTALSTAYLALLIAGIGVRPDIGEMVHDPRFLIEVGAALLTSVMAAAAAFCAGCPGRPVWERFAPFPFLIVWIASLGEGCWRQWVQISAEGRLQFDLTCFGAILALSVVPAMLIFAMIRRGAPIAPRSTTGLASLAATALAAASLRVFHAQDVSLMLVVWQFGSVILLAVLGFWLGRGWLRWRFAEPRLADR